MEPNDVVYVGEPVGSGGGVALRLFAALAVSADTAVQIHAIGETIADQADDVRALDSDSMHVTFAFLGDVSEEYVPAVAASLDAAAMTLPGPVACSLRGTRPFGNGRVLGADVELDLLALLSNARDQFIDSVAPYAPSVDRRAWHPHLSILRSKSGSELPIPAEDAVRTIGRIGWVAGTLHLFASLPAPGGATTHRELHAVPLGQAVLGERGR